MRKFLTAYFFLVIFFVYDTATGHPLSDNFADLVENKSPSVVNVFTVQKPKQTSNNQNPLENIPPQFRDFFKNFPPGFPFGPRGNSSEILYVAKQNMNASINVFNILIK